MYENKKDVPKSADKKPDFKGGPGDKGLRDGKKRMDKANKEGKNAKNVRLDDQ